MAGDYAIVKCSECGLAFSEPLECPSAYYEEDFYAASPGIARLQDKAHLLKRAHQVHATWVAPVLALERLKRILPQGAPVLDVGCGMGLFLALLEEAGFEPIGLEVSRQSVEFLRSMGFRAVEGDVASYPPGWPTPQALTLFEVIEHLPDPVGFLRGIHHRFPDAILLLSTPSPRSWLLRLGLRLPWDYPPNHLLRWSEESLRSALSTAGYRWVELLFPPMSGREIYDVALGSILASRVLRKRRGDDAREPGAKGFWLRLARRFYWPMVSLQDGVLAPAVGALLTPLAWLGNRLGASHSSFLAIAYPQEWTGRGHMSISSVSRARKKAQFYEYLVEDAADEVTRLQHLARYRFAAELVGNRGLVLDIAAGTGYGASYLRRAGASLVVAADISLDALAYGRRSYSGGVEFMGCDAHHLPFRMASFDAVVSFEAIEHLAQPHRFLEECQRILKPSGILIISTPNKAASSPHSPRPVNPFHVREFWPWEFRRMLRCYFEEVTLFGQVPSRRGKLVAFTAYALGKFGPLRALLERTAQAIRGRSSETAGHVEVEGGQFNVVPFSWNLLQTHAYMVAVCRKVKHRFDRRGG